jgi:hypothetical protein
MELFSIKTFVEKPAATQASIRLAGHLLYCSKRANSRSGGHDFESPMRRELCGALTKNGKTFGGQVFLQYIIFDQLQTWALVFKYSWCYYERPIKEDLSANTAYEYDQPFFLPGDKLQTCKILFIEIINIVWYVY